MSRSRIVQAFAVLAFCCAGAAAAAAAPPAAVPSAPAAPQDVATITNPAPAGICVWSCQQNPSGSWSYWFARNLSDCTVNNCQPKSGNSPSGTPCDPGDPDIPGVCSAGVGADASSLAVFFTGGLSCPASAPFR